MSPPTHYNTSNFTIPTFSSDNEDGWSLNTFISLAGVFITAFPVTLLLWKKFRKLRSPQQASPSPQPGSTGEIEMDNRSPVFPEPSSTPVSSRADVELHPGAHQNQVNGTVHTIRLDDTVERLAERRSMAPNGTCRDASRLPMMEVHQSSDRLQQGQPPKLLDRTPFPVEALHGSPDEKREQASLNSEDLVVIVRRATTA